MNASMQSFAHPAPGLMVKSIERRVLGFMETFMGYSVCPAPGLMAVVHWKHPQTLH